MQKQLAHSRITGDPLSDQELAELLEDFDITQEEWNSLPIEKQEDWIETWEVMNNGGHYPE